MVAKVDIVVYYAGFVVCVCVCWDDNLKKKYNLPKVDNNRRAREISIFYEKNLRERQEKKKEKKKKTREHTHGWRDRIEYIN